MSSLPFQYITATNVMSEWNSPKRKSSKEMILQGEMELPHVVENILLEHFLVCSNQHQELYTLACFYTSWYQASFWDFHFIFIMWNFFLKFVLSGFVSPLFYHQRIYDTSLGSRDIAIQIFRCASISCSGYECGGANFFVRYFDSDFWIYTNRSSDLQTLFFTT